MAASDYIVKGQSFLPINAFNTGFVSPTVGIIQIFDPTLINTGIWGASDVSLKAVGIAPDSDVDLLLVRYPDNTVAQNTFNPDFNGGFSQYLVGVGAQLVGQVNATPFAHTGPVAQNKMDGRILFTTTRAFFGPDGGWFDLDPLIAAGFVAKPQLKAIGYLQNPPTLPITRTNYASSAFHQLTGAGPEILLRRPFYGRAICDLTFYNFGGGPWTVTIKGWSLLPGALPAVLATLTINPADVTASFTMQNRFFDGIEVTIAGAAGQILGCGMTFADAK